MRAEPWIPQDGSETQQLRGAVDGVGMTADVNSISDRVLRACIEVHRHLGPGLLEAAYEGALAHELQLSGIRFERQPRIAAVYKGAVLDDWYRADLIVEGLVVVELKAVEIIIEVHRAQLLTYLRASGLPLGLLVNFSGATIRGNVKRIANGAPPL
jgi:GxxExxY protein